MSQSQGSYIPWVFVSKGKSLTCPASVSPSGMWDEQSSCGCFTLKCIPSPTGWGAVPIGWTSAAVPRSCRGADVEAVAWGNTEEAEDKTLAKKALTATQE